MTVAELIANLSLCNHDRTVCVDWDGTISCLTEVMPNYEIGSEPASRFVVVFLVGDPSVPLLPGWNEK